MSPDLDQAAAPGSSAADVTRRAMFALAEESDSKLLLYLQRVRSPSVVMLEQLQHVLKDLYVEDVDVYSPRSTCYLWQTRLLAAARRGGMSTGVPG